MAGFGSLGKIAKELARNPKVREALNSPQTKQMGSKVVDRVADVADKATKGKHQDKIQNARGQAQKHLRGPGDGPQAPGSGPQGPGDGPQTPPGDPGAPRL